MVLIYLTNNNNMIQLEEFKKIEYSNQNHKELKPIVKKVLKRTRKGGIGIKWIELFRNIKPIFRLIIMILLANANETIDEFLNDKL